MPTPEPNTPNPDSVAGTPSPMVGATLPAPMEGVDMSDVISQAAKDYGIPPAILHAEAQRESQLQPQAESPKGAEGVMQLMPQTAAALDVNPKNPVENIRGGAQYLKTLFNQFGDWQHALAAYDWGPRHVRDAVRMYGDNWLDYAPDETKNYVNGIMSQMHDTEPPHPTLRGHGAGGSWTPETSTEKVEREAKNAWQKVKPLVQTPLIKEAPPELTLPAKAAHFAAEYLERNGHPEAAKVLHGYAGIMEGETDLIKGMSSPENLAMMYSLGKLKAAGAAGEVLDRLISGGFSFQQLQQAYTRLPEVKKAIDTGDYETAARALTSEAGTAIMGGMAAHGAVEGTEAFENFKQSAKNEIPQMMEAKTPTGRLAEAGHITLDNVPGAVKVKEATEPLPQDEYLYHATDKSRAEAIEKNGLRPNTWFARTPQDAMRSGAVPISGNRGDLRVYAVPKDEVTPAVPDRADIGAREVEKGRFVQSTDTHIPSHEVTANGHIVRNLRPEDMEAGNAVKSLESTVNTAGGVFKGVNSAGLVEITLPRSMTDQIPNLNDRMKDFVSVTLPRDEVTPENVKAAMDRKLAEFGGKAEETKPWQKTGEEIGPVYHGGKQLVNDVDLAKTGQRDAGFYGKGFYVTKNSDYAKAYGPVISEKEFAPDARILDVDTIHPQYEDKIHPELQKEVEKNERAYLSSLPKAKAKPELVNNYMELIDPNSKNFDVHSWIEAVNRYAEAKGYDALRFSDGEIVLKNPDALTSGRQIEGVPQNVRLERIK
jgi:hypothetical protein